MRGIGESNTKLTKQKNGFMQLIEQHKRAAVLRQLQKIRPLEELAMVFLAQHGDEKAQAVITIGTASEYQPAETFELFLEINDLPVFEQILR